MLCAQLMASFHEVLGTHFVHIVKVNESLLTVRNKYIKSGCVTSKTVKHTVQEVQADKEFIMAIFWNDVEDKRGEEELSDRHDIKWTTARVHRKQTEIISKKS